MMKKTFNTPYIKIVEVKNDIIATSLNTPNDEKGNGIFLAPKRGANIWSDGESVEDMDF